MPASVRTAVILAAGRGRRMWPYDEVRPKATLPVLNTPLVARLADDLAAVGIAQIVVVVGAHAGRIRHALSGRPGVRYARQEAPRGTAEAVLAAVPLLDDGLFLVIHGDLVVDQADLRALLDAAQQGDSLLTALVRPLDGEESRDWICATVVDGLIQDVQGHPRTGEMRLCGAYVLDLRALRYVEDNPGLVENVPVGGMPPLEADLAASLQMMIEQGVTVRAVVGQGLFVDLDKPWHILEANQQAIRAMAWPADVQAAAGARISDGADIRGPVVLAHNASIGPRTVVEGPLWVGAGTTIDNGAMLGGGVVVGPDCRVSNYCQVGGGTVIGPHGVVDHCAEISGVTMDRVYLSHYMEYWGVIGSAVDLGAATVCGNLRFDDGQTVHRVLGRREVPRQGANAVYLGDYCRTGVNVILMPGVKVGAYSCVGPGVVVYDDVAAHTLVMLQQNLTYKSWGPERYGW